MKLQSNPSNGVAAGAGQTRLCGWLLKLSGLAFVAAFFVYHQATAAPPRQGPTEPPSLNEGAALWSENCAPCHGTTGRGDGPTAASIPGEIPDFTDPLQAQQRIPTAMFDVVANGRIEKLMPPWKNRLNEQQMWDVVAYAQSLAVPPATLEAGAAIYAEACAECHGTDGVAAEIDLTRPGLLAEKSQQVLFDTLRSAEGVHASLADLSDEALWQSLASVRTLSVKMPVFDGVLHGQLRNGTTGEIVPDGAVTLYALAASGEAVQTYTTTANADGNFVFEKLDRDHSLSYALEGSYKEISYISPAPAIFVPDTPETELDLVVYETTDDPSVVSQSRLHRIIAFGPGEMIVADVHIFVNDGDRTYIGQTADDGQPQTVEIPLPAEAENPNFQPALVRQVGAFYASSQPIIPGEEAVVSVSYSVPLVGSSLQLAMPLRYDVSVINILAADQGETISGEQLVDQGQQNFQGNTYHLLNGTDLKAGQSLVLQLGDLDKLQFDAPAAVAGQPGALLAAGHLHQTVLLWTLLGLGAAAIAFSIYYSNRTEMHSIEHTATLQQEKGRLLGMLKALETLRQTGDIDDQAYQQVKSRNRLALKRVLAQLREQEL